MEKIELPSDPVQIKTDGSGVRYAVVDLEIWRECHDAVMHVLEGALGCSRAELQSSAQPIAEIVHVYPRGECD